MLSDNWLSRYRLLENLKKCDGNGNGNGNGNAYDRGDYNSSFALRAVELKSRFSHDMAQKKDVMYLVYGLIDRFPDFQIGPGLECQYIQLPSVK